MKTVLELMVDAFPPERPRRSPEYQLGTRQALRSRLEGVRTECPYAQGSVECDAWCAGIEEGHLIFRVEQKRRRAGSYT